MLASVSPAFKIQAVSWLVNAGSGPLLPSGMYPSAITQIVLSYFH